MDVTETSGVIAEDGVQEVPLTSARPLLTRIIEQAREENLVTALSTRGKRRAYVVSPAFHDRAVTDPLRARVRRALGEDTGQPDAGELPPSLAAALERTIESWVHSAGTPDEEVAQAADLPVERIRSLRGD